MKKKLLFAVISLLLLFSLMMQARAASFTGTVMAANYYEFTVQNGTIHKIFQVRGTTTGDKFPHDGDFVLVVYKNIQGALVAVSIKVLRPFSP